MSDLTFVEKMKLEKALGMGSGYVLGFSNRAFHEFIFESTGLDIYDVRYEQNGSSKANRLRTFWALEANYHVGQLLNDIFECWNEVKGYGDGPEPPEECLRIARRLKQSTPVPDISSIIPNSDDKDFKTLAKSVRQSIEKNEPEVGLDRLHTYLVKYFRVLCQKHNISTERGKPLHSLVGGYVKKLKREGLIESDMTERILKSSISVMEAFNTVRNEQSYAHDNAILSYNESLLIFGYVTSFIRFIETIEERSKVQDTSSSVENFYDLPF